MTVTNVGILGYGRFGEFWARQLAADFRIHVHSRTPRPQLVRAAGHTWHDDLASFCGAIDALFLCVSIGSMETTLAKIAPHLRAGCVVMDTCSVKVWPARWLMEQLAEREDIEILASHPLFGPDSATDGLNDLPMVLYPLRCRAETGAYWMAYFRQRGLRVYEMEPHEHDRIAAYTQGLTHYIGRVLNELPLQPSPIDTIGFRHLLSIIEQTCNDSPELFYELQTYNPYTGEMRQELEKALQGLSIRLNSRQ